MNEMHRPLTRIDLNCDLGEAATPEQLTVEQQLFPYITSANIACGLHAGSPALMRQTISTARRHGVAIGAHPGFPDREGSGRREQSWSPDAVATLIAYQVGALSAIAALEGVALSHVKPHGALYHLASRDRDIAVAVVRTVACLDRRLIVMGPPRSELLAAGRALGLRVAAEAFVDRAYHADGRLVSRERTDAVLTTEPDVRARLQHLVREHQVVSIEGTALPLQADTICLHADTPGALALARMVRDALADAGVSAKRLDYADA